MPSIKDLSYINHPGGALQYLILCSHPDVNVVTSYRIHEKHSIPLFLEETLTALERIFDNYRDTDLKPLKISYCNCHVGPPAGASS
jgi:hypothetical protein